MFPLAKTSYYKAAEVYLDTLSRRGVALGLKGDRLTIPAGHTPGEIAFVRGLKPELIEILEQDAQDIFEERAGIFEFEAGMSRTEAEYWAACSVGVFSHLSGVSAQNFGESAQCTLVFPDVFPDPISEMTG